MLTIFANRSRSADTATWSTDPGSCLSVLSILLDVRFAKWGNPAIALQSLGIRDSSSRQCFSRNIGPFTISPLSSMLRNHKRRASSTFGRVTICGHLLDSAVGFSCARLSISSRSFNLRERVACVNSSAPSARVRKKLTTSVCVSSGCLSM